MRIMINGAPEDLDKSLTILELLKKKGIDPGLIAVAVNSTVVPRGKLGEKVLIEGDSIEIIEAVGGG
jgi:sulfur carrier protein